MRNPEQSLLPEAAGVVVSEVIKVNKVKTNQYNPKRNARTIARALKIQCHPDKGGNPQAKCLPNPSAPSVPNSVTSVVKSSTPFASPRLKEQPHTQREI